MSTELNTVKQYEAVENLDLTGKLFYSLSQIHRLEQRLKTHEISLKCVHTLIAISHHFTVLLSSHFTTSLCSR